MVGLSTLALPLISLAIASPGALAYATIQGPYRGGVKDILGSNPLANGAVRPLEVAGKAHPPKFHFSRENYPVGNSLTEKSAEASKETEPVASGGLSLAEKAEGSAPVSKETSPMDAGDLSVEADKETYPSGDLNLVEKVAVSAPGGGDRRSLRGRPSV
jgi:hypothetical protein